MSDIIWLIGVCIFVVIILAAYLSVLGAVVGIMLLPIIVIGTMMS